MSAYIKIATGEYFFYEGDIRLEYPNMGEEFICPPTYAPIKATPVPTFNDMLEGLVCEPRFVDGEWVVVYQVVPLPQERIAALQAQYGDAIESSGLDLSKPGSAPNVID